MKSFPEIEKYKPQTKHQVTLKWNRKNINKNTKSHEERSKKNKTKRLIEKYKEGEQASF